MQPTFHRYPFLVNKFMTQLGGIEISFNINKTYFLLLKSITRNTFCMVGVESYQTLGLRSHAIRLVLYEMQHLYMVKIESYRSNFQPQPFNLKLEKKLKVYHF